MRAAQVLYNGQMAGILSKAGGSYYFQYDKNYLATTGSRAVSLTLPLSEKVYESDILFPAFVNMLSEGANRFMQSKMLRIDENDFFSLLLATASTDSIGPITIQAINEHTEH